MKIFKLLILNILFFTIIFLCNNVYAEGSADLIRNAPPDSYRAHLEWQAGNTLGIPRKSTLQVYAKTGEVLNFGSSVYNSYDSQDIVVTYPNGASTFFDVLNTGYGYINTLEKEKIGPFPNLGGYIPIQIEVTEEGIYSFEFHGVLYTQGPNANPNDVKVSQPFIANQASTVSAWDITVTQNNIPITGRLFSNYLSLNVGKNITGNDFLVTRFFVLTKDGYLYRTSLDDVDPFGFLVFSNNRGLINGNTGDSLYHSARATNNEFIELIGNVQVPQPQNGDTESDVFHRIFFNTPADDLPETIITTPIPPASATNFKFTGIEDNVTREGVGGYFSFDVDKTTTFQIEITTETGTILIGSNTVVGNNQIYWDGLDVNRNIVPTGKYSAILKVKGGEYHFPFFDVENSHGLTIELLNPPYIYEGFNPYMIYYNNSNYYIGSTYVDLSGTGITNPVDASIDGIDSSPIDSFTFTNSYGDEKALDIWTYFNSESLTTDFFIVGENKSVLSGFIFYDYNRNGIYEPNKGEKPFPNVEIKIISSSEQITVYSNDNGIYSTIIDFGEYTINVIAPDGYEVTTNNLSQTVIANSDITLAENVGFANDQYFFIYILVFAILAFICWIFIKCKCEK